MKQKQPTKKQEETTACENADLDSLLDRYITNDIGIPFWHLLYSQLTAKEREYRVELTGKVSALFKKTDVSISESIQYIKMLDSRFTVKMNELVENHIGKPFCMDWRLVYQALRGIERTENEAKEVLRPHLECLLDKTFDDKMHDMRHCFAKKEMTSFLFEIDNTITYFEPSPAHF